MPTLLFLLAAIALLTHPNCWLAGGAVVSH